MSDFNVRSDTVNVEQVMEQIRSRIREKRGVDYTEQQIRELAAVKLEKFLDPKVVRSDLLQHFLRRQADPPVASYTFEDSTLFDSPRPLVRRLRRLLRPVLKLFFNPDPLIQALHIQARLNEVDRLHYELFHNLVIEMTRTGIEVRNLKMRIESLTGRLEFNERRARALESVVAYQPSAEDMDRRPPAHRPASPPAFASAPSASAGETAPAMIRESDPSVPQEGPGQRSRRRRRRRGRRGGGPAAALMEPSTSPAEQRAGAPGESPSAVIVEGGQSPSMEGSVQSGSPVLHDHDDAGGTDVRAEPASEAGDAGHGPQDPDTDQ